MSAETTGFPFTGRRVLITGAAGLIGRALVSAFATAGADVIAADINKDALAHSVLALSGLTPSGTEKASAERVETVVGDVGDVAFVAALFERYASTGGIDVVVNNAARTDVRTPFLETDVELFDEMVAANLRSVYLVSLHAGRSWHGRNRGGVIVNISSPGAQRAHANQSIYAATKGGVDALSRAMATELGPLGIRVVCVVPAQVRDYEEPADELPLRRSVHPDDVAQAVLFAASPAARGITGSSLVVDSGLLAQLRTPTVGPV